MPRIHVAIRRLADSRVPISRTRSNGLSSRRRLHGSYSPLCGGVMLCISRLVAVRNHGTSPLRRRAGTLFGSRVSSRVWVVSPRRARAAVGGGRRGVTRGRSGVRVIRSSPCRRSVGAGDSLGNAVSSRRGVVMSRRSIGSIRSVSSRIRVIGRISIRWMVNVRRIIISAAASYDGAHCGPNNERPHVARGVAGLNITGHHGLRYVSDVVNG